MKNRTMRTSVIYAIISTEKYRSAWDKGVQEYASEILWNLDAPYLSTETLEGTLLNGAKDWKQYSYGGCALIYDGDIAERLCTPSELKRKKGGQLQPNSRETWLDVQARALKQAFWKIRNVIIMNSVD